MCFTSWPVKVSRHQGASAVESTAPAPSGATANTSYTVTTPDFPRIKPARIAPLALRAMSAFVAFRKASVTRLASSVPAAMSVKVLGRSCGEGLLRVGRRGGFSAYDDQGACRRGADQDLATGVRFAPLQTLAILNDPVLRLSTHMLLGHDARSRY